MLRQKLDIRQLPPQRFSDTSSVLAFPKTGNHKFFTGVIQNDDVINKRLLTENGAIGAPLDNLSDSGPRNLSPAQAA